MQHGGRAWIVKRHRGRSVPSVWRKHELAAFPFLVPTRTRHAAHVEVGQPHIHVYNGPNEIFALNKDGTAHDRSHGVEIPNKVYKALQTRLPYWNLPPNRLIESCEG